METTKENPTYEVVLRTPETLRFRCINMLRAGLRITSEEPRWWQAKIDSGTEFFNSLSDEDAKRICFQELESEVFGDWMIGQWFLTPPSENPSEWYVGLKRYQKQQAEKAIPEMKDSVLAAFIRENNDHKHALAEAIARILSRG